MTTYKKQLKDKDGNTIYPDVGLNLDDVVYSDDPESVGDDYIDPESYSTNEKKTGGTWVNGKPIYKKSIYISSFPNATTTTYFLANNVKDVVKLYGQMYRSTDNATFVLPYPSALSLANIVDLTFLGANNSVQVRTGSDRSNCSGYVTVEYTKTTD